VCLNRAGAGDENRVGRWKLLIGVNCFFPTVMFQTGVVPHHGFVVLPGGGFLRYTIRPNGCAVVLSVFFGFI
jgi:hypothetical protein